MTKEVTEIKPKKATLDRIGDVVGDIIDIAGLCLNIFKDVRGMSNKDTGKALLGETETRGLRIRSNRKKSD